MVGVRQRVLDRLYVLLLGAAIAGLAWAWRFETPPPDLMEDLAAAAGIRPPTGPLSLIWHLAVSALVGNFGLQSACEVVRTAGHVSLGIMAVMAVALLEMMIPLSLKRGEHLAAWWRAAVRFVVFQGAAFFCLSEPVWKAFRWFSPLSLHVLLAAAAVLCLFSHLVTARRAPLFAAFAVLGFMSADTSAGAAITAIAVVALGVRRYLRSIGVLVAPEDNPLADSLIAWRLTLMFALGALTGTALEVVAFSSMDGLAALGWTWGDYALEIPIAYLKSMLSSCSPVGAALVAGAVVFPVVIELKVIKAATDPEKHLSYLHGMLFAVFGLMSFSQLSGAHRLWFWTWGGERGCIADGVLKCSVAYACALLAVWSLAVFTMELYLRNFRRIEMLRFPDAAEEPGAAESLALVRRVQRLVRACFLLVPAALFACVLPFRPQQLEHAMLGVVADAARETAEECRGADFVFTDGGLDAAVELASAMSGGSLRALSLMGAAAEPREVYLRTRGVDDAEDKALLESGAPDALRIWVRTRPDKAASYAVQIGFELWRRDGRPMPECSGLVARPCGFEPDEAKRGAAAGRRLEERVLAIYEEGDPDGITDRDLRDAFVFAQWRLAILGRHRANAYDERGERNLAMGETILADSLDKRNGALERIRATMAWASRKKLERMTPQEGLRIGLAKADFAFARAFAMRVLDVSPDDPAANFALGMDFFVQRQYARAQAHLERCLERRPDDPAVLNNLAQCRLRQGDPEGALPYAKRALAILPDSPEIKRTMERVNSDIASKAAK